MSDERGRSDEQDRAHLWASVSEIGTCMMVTRDGPMLRARPMQAMPKPEEAAIWFLTDRDTHKEDEIRRDSSACLTFADHGRRLYVSITGDIELNDAQDKIHELWTPEAEIFFSGPDDPRIVALRFTPRIAGLWDQMSFEVVDDADKRPRGEASFGFGEHRGDERL